MQFSMLPIAAVLALAAGLVHAAPTDTDDAYPGLVISKVVPMGAYSLTFWSDAPGSDAALATRAPVPCSGNSDVTCYSGNKADSGICNQLVNNLNANSGTVVDNSPRAICFGQSGNQCGLARLLH
ncbi:hypothetical protein B0H17DRAFT_1199717 [Mycena rosella]|uniref:Uncharacterized protein n=1 Tax=Mycena rosella TaxID=1033263 RepID=A0AAD7DKS3_MYCRO|nr:hypothetical protein B0H17DRAFT_1199717 [Mycena rosella]